MHAGAARRSLALIAFFTALAVAGTQTPADEARAADNSCQVSVRGPFFYAGFVFPSTEIACETVKQTIRLEASLHMDGTEVATAERTCRKTDRCRLSLASDGIFAYDVPGDQLWCGSVTGSISDKGPRHELGTAVSCESESF